MKNLRLIVFLGLIVSCTPNISSTNVIKPSSKPTSSTVPSANPTPIVTASIPILDTTPIPTPSPTSSADFKDLKIKEIRIYDENGIVAVNNYKLPKVDSTTYNILSGETKRFYAEIVYENGLISKNFTWKSSNTQSVSVDTTGMIKTEKEYGSSYIYLSDYDKFNNTFGISVNYLKKLSFTQTTMINCQSVMTEIPLSRYQFNYLGDVGITPDIRERATFNGKVYDPNNVPVEGATVNAFSIDPGVNWIGESQVTVGGAYVFRNAPLCAKIAITVTKDGWTTRTRTETLKSNLQGDPMANVFNFANIYAIQDEPEITQLKVNGIVVNKSSRDDEFLINSNTPKNSKPTPKQMENNQITNIGNIPEITGVKSDKLEIEMTFSESIRIDDVRNFFRLTSQPSFDNRAISFTVDANYSGVEFVVSGDEKVVTFKTNKAVLANKDGDEARYLIDFSQAFRDKTDKSAIDRRYFKFSPSQINDFAVFSVKNDEEAPKLLNIVARDGGSANDTIELRYSEPMELINQASYPAGLADPAAPSSLARQLWYRDTNSVKSDISSITNSTDDNNATLVGYLSGSDADTNAFRASYMIGRILSKDITNGTPKMVTLGTLGRATVTTPVKGNTTANNLLRNARITGNNVLLEFSPTAFDRDDIIVLAVSGRIAGNYVDRNRTPSINEELTVNSNTVIEYTHIYDPAGLLIDTGNSSGVGPIDVHNQQRFTTAS